LAAKTVVVNLEKWKRQLVSLRLTAAKTSEIASALQFSTVPELPVERHTRQAKHC